MEQKDTVINPFTGREIIIGGRTYKLVEKRLLDWLEDKCARGPDPNRPKLYCGKGRDIPEGYARAGTPFECLRKGYGAGTCGVYREFKG